MNKNSNTYQIVYSAIMVLLVGTLLAFVYMALKPQQNANIANDTRKQILGALHIVPTADNDIEGTYTKYIVQDLLVDTDGNVVDSTANVAFNVNMKKNSKLPAEQQQHPVMVCKLDDGSVKYVFPLYGAGLWGPIWGYVAVNADGNTIYGTNFEHESETPGLGARITEQTFRDEFNDKNLFKDGEFKSVAVMKRGQKATNGADQVDALTGATITSRGVSDMMEKGLAPYAAFLKRLQGKAPMADPVTSDNNNDQQSQQ